MNPLETIIRQELAEAVEELGPVLPYKDTATAYKHGRIDTLRFVIEVIEDLEEQQTLLNTEREMDTEQ